MAKLVRLGGWVEVQAVFVSRGQANGVKAIGDDGVIANGVVMQLEGQRVAL